MDTINGYVIIAQSETPRATATRAGRVILVDRGENTFQRYVTAWQGRDGNVWDSSWCWGHYFEDKANAHIDYCRRTARGY